MTAQQESTIAVRDALDIRLHTDDTRSIVDVERLVNVALRRNPKRAHLLVSTVLAKHVPTVPAVALAAGELLGLLVSGALGGEATRDADRLGARLGGRLGSRFAALIDVLAETPSQTDAATAAEASRELADLRRDIRAATAARHEVVTIGYAETATGLGQLVADALGAYYLHSTRHSPDGPTPFAGFAEEHSHATDHQLLPTDASWLREGGTVALIDDELSTGTTVINTIAALHSLIPQRHWVVASLIDLRSTADRERFAELATTLDTRISVVCLAAGSIELPADVLPRAERIIAAIPATQVRPVAPGSVTTLDCTDLALRSARFGTTAPVDAAVAVAVADRVHAALRAQQSVTEPATDSIAGDRGVLVLGSEEFMALPMLAAHELHGLVAPRSVRFSTSTRSPIAALDQPGYPIAGAIRFRSHDTTSDGIGQRFAYNLTASGSRFSSVVFMPEPGTDPALLEGDGGALDALRRVTDHVIVVLLGAITATDGTSAP